MIDEGYLVNLDDTARGYTLVSAFTTNITFETHARPLERPLKRVQK